MSTVLRPVGPHEPRVYWVRRAVLVGLLVVLIIVLTETLSGGSAKPAAKKNHPGAHPSTTTSSSAPSTSTPPSTPASTVAQAACAPSALKLTLKTDSDHYTSGQAAKLIGKFSNTGSAGCTLSVAPSKEDWTVMSGTDTIWMSKGCASSEAAKQVTIQAGGTKSVSTFWDGHRLDPGCKEGSAALNGEYTLHATLDGVPAPKPAVFHVVAAP